MGSHYIPVGKIKIDKDILDIVCPAAGYDNTPPPPEIYCEAEGYIKDPTIPVPENFIDDFIEKDTWIPGDADTNQYLMFLIDRTRSPNQVFQRASATGTENKVFAMDGTLLETHPNNQNIYDLSEYSEDVVVIRLKFNTGINIVIQPTQPSGMPASGVVAILSGVQSANVNCTNQVHLKRIRYFKPLQNIGTMTYTGCESLYHIIWADASLGNTSAASMFRYCKFQYLLDLPDMSNVVNASYFVGDTLSLEEVNMPFIIENLTNGSNMFNNTPKLRKINGKGKGDTLELNFDNITTIGNIQYLFDTCNFSGKLKIGLKNCAGLPLLIVNSNLTEIIFTTLENATTNHSSGCISNCPKLKYVEFSDDYRGDLRILSQALSGEMPSLEEIQFPMDSTGKFSNVIQFNFLNSLRLAPKLREIRGRLGFDMDVSPTYLSLRPELNPTTYVFTFVPTVGRFPSLEKIDYPSLPITTCTIEFCKNLKIINAKHPTVNNIKIANANISVEQLNLIIFDIAPWMITTNTYREVDLTGNKISLPIFRNGTTSYDMENVHQDKMKILKSNSSGDIYTGMKYATAHFVAVEPGNTGSPLILKQVGQNSTTAPGQAMSIGDKFIFVGNYSSYVSIQSAIAAGVPPFQILYINAVNVSGSDIFYEISFSSGGSSITYQENVASAFDIQIRRRLTVIDVTDDASYYYVILNRSTFYHSSSGIGQTNCFWDPAYLDSDRMFLLNRRFLIS